MDTFAQFVEVLSEHLDDADLSSGRLADRLHLSRSHSRKCHSKSKFEHWLILF